MPHANEPERFKRIVEQMKSVKIITLSEYRGGKAKPIDDIEFPPVGKTGRGHLREQPAGSDAVRLQPHDLRSAGRTRPGVAGRLQAAGGRAGPGLRSRPRSPRSTATKFREVAERIFSRRDGQGHGRGVRQEGAPRQVPAERTNDAWSCWCFSRSSARSACRHRRPSIRRRSRPTASR